MQLNDEMIVQRILAQFNADFLDEPFVALPRFRRAFGRAPRHIMRAYTHPPAVANFVLQNMLRGAFARESVRATFLFSHHFERAGLVSKLEQTHGPLSVVSAAFATGEKESDGDSASTNECAESRCVVLTDNFMIYANITYVLRPELIWYSRLTEISAVRPTADGQVDHVWVGLQNGPRKMWHHDDDNLLGQTSHNQVDGSGCLLYTSPSPRDRG